MKDFENWLQYHRTFVGPIDLELALSCYNEYYKCNCITCQYRKEKGYIPVRLNASCLAPEDADGLEILVSQRTQ